MVWKAIVTCLVIILGKIVEVSLNTLKTMILSENLKQNI